MIDLIHSAETQYHLRFKRFGSLSDLGPDGAALIDWNFATGCVHEYRFRLDARENRYRLWAEPQLAAWRRRCCRMGFEDLYRFETDETRLLHFGRNCGPATEGRCF
jgi:hypothetical protein